MRLFPSEGKFSFEKRERDCLFSFLLDESICDSILYHILYIASNRTSTILRVICLCHYMSQDLGIVGK